MEKEIEDYLLMVHSKAIVLLKGLYQSNIAPMVDTYPSGYISISVFVSKKEYDFFCKQFSCSFSPFLFDKKKCDRKLELLYKFIEHNLEKED